MPYAEARRLVHGLQLENQMQWQEWSKSGRRQSNIPSTPDRVYRGKGWVNLADWLGPGCSSTHSKNREWLPFAEARRFVHGLQLVNCRQWEEWRRSCRLDR